MNLIQTQVDAELGEGTVFEPNSHSLEEYGLGALVSIMQVNNQRKVFLPVVNYHQSERCVHG